MSLASPGARRDSSLPPLQGRSCFAAHPANRQLSIATASAFVTSVSKALTDKKASLANISAPLALNWATLQVQYVSGLRQARRRLAVPRDSDVHRDATFFFPPQSDAKHATQLTKDLLSNERCVVSTLC